MSDSSDNCDKRPLIALWFLHKTTTQVGATTGDEQLAAIRLQRHYIALANQYGVTVDQVADSLDITQQMAEELMSMGEVLR